MKIYTLENRGHLAGAIEKFEITAGKLHPAHLRDKTRAQPRRFLLRWRRNGSSLRSRRRFRFRQSPSSVRFLRPNNCWIDQRHFADHQRFRKEREKPQVKMKTLCVQEIVRVRRRD